MSHESANGKPHSRPARATVRGRRVKLFAPRFVSLLCAALLVALWAAQVSGAYQDPGPTQTQPPAPARTQPPPAAGSQPQTTTAQQPQTTTAAAQQQQQQQTPATPAPSPPSPRVVRAYNIDALFQPTPAPTPTPQPTPQPTPCPPNAQCPTPTPTPGPTPVPFVDRDEAMSAGLNDIVVVEVARLKHLVLLSKCLREKADKQTEPVGGGCKPQPILLFLDGRPLKGMPPESTSPELIDGENGRLRYHLQRPVKSDAVTEGEVDDTKEHWADLLGLSYDDVFEDFSPFTRPVSVSVGLADEYPIETDVEREGTAGRFSLVRVRLLRFLTWAGLLAVFVYLFYRLAREADIIRDRKPIAWERGNRQRKAYSLGRSQIAWWTFFVAFGFIFIWLVTGQYDLSPSVLILLGISIITTGGAIAIDKSRTVDTAGDTKDTNADLSQLLTKKDAMEQELTQKEGKIPGADFKRLEDAYKALIADIRRRFPTALGWSNHRFDIDILSDANGVSIHRFQMVLWTVVLGFVFVHEVLTRLSMPEFSGTLLLLMGISNGTYLFGKSSEPQATPAGGETRPASATGGSGGDHTAGRAGATDQTNQTDASGAADTTNATNAAGANSEPNATGATTGTSGETGATGDTGETAEAGEAGETGETGETGESG